MIFAPITDLVYVLIYSLQLFLQNYYDIIWITLFLSVCDVLLLLLPFPIIVVIIIVTVLLQIENCRFILRLLTSCLLRTDGVWLVTANVRIMFFSPSKFIPTVRLLRSTSNSVSSPACIPHHYSTSLISSQLRQLEVTATSPCSCCKLCNTWAKRVG